ncbi:MAG: hypothetical protein ACRDOU_14975 [Streptosporangiaceae bacterium]
MLAWQINPARADDAIRRQLLWLLLACLAVFGCAGLWWGVPAPGRSWGCW